MYAEDTKTSTTTRPHSYGFTMYSPVKSVSSSPGKPLTVDDLSSYPYALQQSSEAKELADMRQKLLNMRTENSHLVAQNHNLLSELEDSSHQLLIANSKFDSLHHQMSKQHDQTSTIGVGQGLGWEQRVISAVVERDAAAIHVMELEKQVASLKTESLKQQKEAMVTTNEAASLLDKERKEWDMKQAEMVKQVADLQEECSRLRDANSLAEERVIQSRTESCESLSSICSSQPSHFMHSSGFHSLPSYSPTLQQHTVHRSHDLYTSVPTSTVHSAANPTMPHSGSVPVLHYSMADRVTTKGQFDPARPATHFHDLQKRLNESSLKSNRDALVTDLEKSRYQIKKFEGKVSLLDSQLKEKSTMMEEYVSELSQLRSQITKIKMNQEREALEFQEQCSREAEQIRIAHGEQCQQLESQVIQSRRSCDAKEALVSQLQTELQAVHSESQSHARNVMSLQSELDRERLSHQEAMLSLSSDVRLGEAHVSQLEKALEMCRSELQDHVSKIEADGAHHDEVIRVYKHQMELLQSELTKAHSKLESSSQEVEVTRTELKNSESRYNACWLSQRKCEAEANLYKTEFEKLSAGVQQLRTNHAKEVTELKQQVAKSETLRNSLVQQVYSLHHNTQELAVCKEELATLKKSHSSELAQLQKQLSAVNLELSTAHDGWRLCEEELESQLHQSEKKRSETEYSLAQLQEDLLKRSQQVSELDVALRSHQADTTSRRLQLERALTQRQADLRARTQEVDDLRESLLVAKQTIESSAAERDRVKSSFAKQIDKKSLEAKELVEVIEKQEEKIGDLESATHALHKELLEAKEEMRKAQEVYKLKEKHYQASKDLGEKEVHKVKKQLDSMQEQHVHQIQRLQESHARVLASRDQQSSAHRLQVQHMHENESRRMEELSRCRAQVTSLSAELTAERFMSEEARQQITLLGAETARLQAQVASLQRAISIVPDHEQKNFSNSEQERNLSGYQGGNYSNPLPSQTRKHSYSSPHISKTPSVSSSDTESILTSEVEFKVLPTSTTSQNRNKIANEFENNKRKKGDIFDV